MAQKQKNNRGSNKKINEQKRKNSAPSAPLFHSLNLMALGDSARFHMPGHKGQPLFKSFADVFSIDYTETYGTGNVYLSEGAVRQAEIEAARYWQAKDLFFLTGGSTQGIMAMLATAVGEGGAVLLDRECHKSVCHACALLDITPYFLMPDIIDEFEISGNLSVLQAERMLKQHPEIRAIFLTSPTYYGICRDIEAFAHLCKREHIRLLVDAAHGAHFPAVDQQTPTAQGADIAVLSIHKTLPCLGQGAALLMGEHVNAKALRENTSVFGTSSPSYPIMASMDLARAYMQGNGRADYRRAMEYTNYMRKFITRNTHFWALDKRDHAVLDPCRLTVCTSESAMSGHEMADTLWKEYGISCEMADDKNVVFILTCADNPSTIYRLRKAIRKISRKTEPMLGSRRKSNVRFPEAERVMSVRKAWFSQHAKISVGAAKGQICARPITPYPPGVPLMWPGEKITEAHIELLRGKWYNTIDEVAVVISER